MPNHCSNDLRVNGSKKDIKEFFAKVKSVSEDEYDKGDEIPIDANKIIPYPEKYAALDRAARDFDKKAGKTWASGRPTDGFNQGGYEWCIKNWGTKWGLYDFTTPKFGNTFATISFDTAWSPPCPIFLEASKQFPKLTFTLKFYECGAAYQGTYKVKNGKVLKDETLEYNGNRGG